MTSTPKARPELKGGLSLPFLGHALDFHLDPVGVFRRGREQFGDVFYFKMLGRTMMCVSGPEAHEAYFRAPEDQLAAKEVYQFMVPIFGRNIVYDSTPAVMDEQLAFIFPALRDERLRKYAAIMQDEAEKYFAQWGESGTADLYDTTNELTTFIATRCLIGPEFREYMSNEFARLYKELEGGINMVSYFISAWAPTPANRRRDRARARIVEVIQKIIDDRRRSTAEHEDFLQTLMTAKYKDGSKIADDEIAGLLVAMIFAGQHTSAVLSAWTGIEVLRHPFVIPKLLAEQEAIFPNNQGDITLDKLRQMDVLNRVIMENERMHPPLIMLARYIKKPFEFKGHVGNVGEVCMVSPGMAHRIPEVFKDPDRWDPDRFAPPREEHKAANYTLIGFGGGKHRCIGMTFAYLQIKAIFSVLLRNFELELIERNVEPNYSKSFVVGPKQPCNVRYRRKKTAQIRVPGSSEGAKSAAGGQCPVAHE